MELFDRNKAAADLLPRAQNLALSYLRKYPGLLDRSDAESVAGFALAIALIKYDPQRGPIEPLVDAIVRRRSMQEVHNALQRRRLEHPTIRVDALEHDDFESLKCGNNSHKIEPVSLDDVEAHLVTLERHAAIVRGIKRVAAEDLGLLRARSQGKTYRQIGAAVGVRGQSVHERIAKARRTILAELEVVA